MQHMYSWWWVELSPETCRVKPLRRINAIVASCWIYFTTDRGVCLISWVRCSAEIRQASTTWTCTIHSTYSHTSTYECLLWKRSTCLLPVDRAINLTVTASDKTNLTSGCRQKTRPHTDTALTMTQVEARTMGLSLRPDGKSAWLHSAAT